MDILSHRAVFPDSLRIIKAFEEVVILQLQAHRGVCTEYPENTMAAFLGAIYQDYKIIEFYPNGKCLKRWRSVRGEEEKKCIIQYVFRLS